MGRVLRFIKALWNYILHGKRVGFNEYVERLNACDNCVYLNRNKWVCDNCGCYVIKKAKMSTEKCLKDRW